MRLASFALLTTFSVTACSKPADQGADSPVGIPPGALSQVRWLEGTWMGTGAEGTTQEPFFERYTISDANTLVVESFQDSTLQLVTDTTRYVQVGDSLTNPGPGPRWMAAAVGPDSILFVPLSGAKNTFVFRRGDDSTWTAVLDWPMVDSVARHRVYRMARIKKV